MSYIERKLNSLAGDALSKIGDMSRRRGGSDERQAGDASGSSAKDTEEGDAAEKEALRGLSPTSLGAQLPASRPIGWQTERGPRSPFGGGIPFGGDSYSLEAGYQAPPIGFRLPTVGDVSTTDQKKAAPREQLNDSLESSESLYQGDCRKLSWYPRLFFACLLRLLAFIGKIYQDFHATKYYNLLGLTGYFLISAATLFLPTIMFTLYRVARYLQIALPARAISAAQCKPLAATEPASQVELNENKGTRASSPDARSAASPTFNSNEDEGLVTARQTPCGPDDYAEESAKSAARQLPKVPESRRHRVQQQQQQQLVSVNVNKMGQLPDKHKTSVTIGASEQLLQGVLFIFWHFKRQVDVLSFLVARACKWRAPTQAEVEQLERMQTDSNGLEWFQDFYAAFLAILTQVYTIGLVWSNELRSNSGALFTPEAFGAPDKLSTLGSSSTLVNTLGQVARSWEPRDLLVFSQLAVSLAVLVSLLVAVRRLDDGPLTLAMSMIGWGALFSARTMIIAFAFLHLGWTLMLALVALHVLAVAGWIYKIALDSHDDKPSERQHEAMWDHELETRLANEQQSQQQLKGLEYNTSRWGLMDHVALLTQIFTLFAIPSLFYWPIMFNLKLHARPFKYLLVILVQNFILIPLVWHQLESPSAGQLYALGAVGALSIVGFIFIALYVACKPDLTEYFAQADEQFNQAKQAGVYYEYCSRVFKMPNLNVHKFRRLMKQDQVIETVEIVTGGS